MCFEGSGGGLVIKAFLPVRTPVCLRDVRDQVLQLRFFPNLGQSDGLAVLKPGVVIAPSLLIGVGGRSWGWRQWDFPFGSGEL